MIDDTTSGAELSSADNAPTTHIETSATEFMSSPEPGIPSRPERTQLPSSEPKREKLVKNVRDALAALPFYFRSTTAIEGLEAGDLFSLNTVLGGTIEVQTVTTLNRIREVWDPDDEWSEYGFERSSQTFPDVRLVSRSADKPSPVLGIELKGWYLLSKEGEPSFRYTASRKACSEFDLLVVVPWRLSNVLAGVPVVYEPFVEQAMYAADLRNYYWENLRGASGDTGITSPAGATPYPSPKVRTADKANSDGGSNFGRVARVPDLMDSYCDEMLKTPVAGIRAKHWVSFFKTYSDNANTDQVDAAIQRALARVSNKLDDARSDEIGAVLHRLQELISGNPPAAASPPD
ncbi:hypothetical protein [Arthrobacter sp. STN4]|uniref:hypothetical protein n=1 Tax=Arthrobacter sp. STN4 TaxID=2923276 RepID=UPI002119D18C|nr:hypothetical protein [Arthrobacter sp. STN4]MCQ9165492.1 hypothetical protein [Arthrobacter sp. STN4]